MHRKLLAVIFVLLLLWILIPVARAAVLIETHGGAVIRKPPDLSVKDIQFQAMDGAGLHGWLVLAKATSPLIILAPGFKSDRMSMLPYGRFLHSAGYSVLMYDGRGTGESGGQFTVGVREVGDVLGAVRYAAGTLGSRRIGLFGVSLGAGVVIVAAASDDRIRATVADSGYTSQDAVLALLDRLRIGPIAVPLAPVGPAIVDRLTHASVSTFRPVRWVGKIAPRALLLVHSQHDTNPTTPLSEAIRLYHGAGKPVELWIAPHGDHAGALAAQPDAYRRHVGRFFRRFLGT